MRVPARKARATVGDMTSPKTARTDAPTIAPTPDAMHVPVGMIPLGRTRPEVEGERSVRPGLVAIDDRDLAGHMLISGATGSGKSMLLGQIALAVARTGGPLVVIDGHGMLADMISAAVCTHLPERATDIVDIDLGDRTHVTGLNPLDVRDAADIDAAVAVCTALVMQRLAADGQLAPRAINYAQIAYRALAEANLRLSGDARLGLLDMPVFYTDDTFRRAVVAAGTNDTVRQVVGADDAVFEQYSEQTQIGHVLPLLRSIRAAASSQNLSNILAAPALDLTALLQREAIILIRPPRHPHTRGDISFLGALLLPMLAGAVEAAAGQGVKPPRIIIDSAGQVLRDALGFGENLVRLNSHGAGMIVAVQSPLQLDDPVRDALYAHAKSVIALGHVDDTVGALHAVISTPARRLEQEDLLTYPERNGAWARLQHGGETLGPFPLSLLAPLPYGDQDTIDQVRERTRAQFGAPATEITAAREHRRERIMRELA